MGRTPSRIAAFLCLALAVCAPGLVQAGPQKEDVTYTAASIPRFKSTWFDRLETGLTKAGAALRIKVTQLAPSPADSGQQARLIDDAINQGSNAILVVPGDPRSIELALARAQARKIVTVTHQSPNQGHADFDVEMIDSASFGQLAMEEMVKAMGSPMGGYSVFVGSFTVADHNMWADAAIARARQKYPGLRLVGERFAVSEDQGLSRQTALGLMAAYPDIRAFLAFGSQGGPGIAQALRAKSLVGKIAVIGTTGPIQASAYLKDGSLSASILWDPAEAGYAMVYLARLALDGKRNLVGPDMDIPGLGKPFSAAGNTLVYNRPVILTRDNVDDFSGF